MNQRDNPQRIGECANCYEEADRLFDPPCYQVARSEVTPERPHLVVGVPMDYVPGASVWWKPDPRVPADLCDVIDGVDDGSADLILRWYEWSGEPICWSCYGQNVPPGCERWLCNKPVQIVLKGWGLPEWEEPTI